jgi:AraC family transcriptional regulator
VGLTTDLAIPDLARLAPGPYRVLRSRRAQGQPGVMLESHYYLPGERGAVGLDWHLMVLLRSAANRGVRTEAHGESFPIANRRGAITVLPAGFAHGVRLTTACEVTVFAFAPEILASVSDETGRSSRAGLEYIAATRDGCLRDLLDLLARELEAGGPSGRMYADGLAFTLLARALALSGSRMQPLSVSVPALYPRAQQQLFEYIDENLHRNLALEELAFQGGYSRGHFLKIFRTATGTSPHQYLVQRRVERAKALLSGGKLPLAEIAVTCGFSSQSHFSAEFRRRVGTSPVRYRRVR